MASACVNNIGMSPENFLDCPPVKCPSYGWLSPKISFSREESSKAAGAKSENVDLEKPEESDPEISVKDFVDFEFQLEDPVTMLPADELFSDGKLVPLHISTIRQSTATPPATSDLRSSEIPNLHRRNEISPTDPYLFSPKAPTCSIRWKELLRLKKLYQNKQEDSKTASSLSSNNNNSNNRSASRSLKYFLHRSSKSSLNTSIDSSLNLPLLKDPDTESSSISSRLSLSSSSSSHEHDDLPRLSLDSDKANTVPRNTHHQATTSNLSKVRVAAKHRSAAPSEKSSAATRTDRSPLRRAPETTVPALGVSMDSPRMNSSGKIVFQSLERSSSSPSTFNGGPRYKHRGMERSYSANVRVTPVLNVPVCTLRGSSKSGVFGLPLFASQPKKDSSVGAANRTHQHHSRNRTDRT
ncbi:hypothetical protein BUALT_Bualt18G0081500 [Buddleja alternifolia]|uniref:Uncharacterized protein n=1 Tax=Buddleja alternifolia TaxID=168488 RepID=A0AAV6W401_9LAMI|nr:hypothetical protein BUALT_Bualt18G0081500 [Buddleja alternifolia]